MKIQIYKRLWITLNILRKNVFICILGFAVEKDGKMIALLTENRLLRAIMDKNLKNTDLVKTAWTKEFVIFDDSICVSHLAKLC